MEESEEKTSEKLPRSKKIRLFILVFLVTIALVAVTFIVRNDQSEQDQLAAGLVVKNANPQENLPQPTETVQATQSSYDNINVSTGQ